MRVLDCDCGKTLQAGSDADLEKAVREHVDEAHTETEFTDDQVRSLVAERAYEASDA